MYLFAYDMIIYVKKSKASTKKLLKLLNDFSKVTSYKMNVQKPNFSVLVMNTWKMKLKIKYHLQSLKKE